MFDFTFSINKCGMFDLTFSINIWMCIVLTRKDHDTWDQENIILFIGKYFYESQKYIMHNLLCIKHWCIVTDLKHCSLQECEWINRKLYACI